MYVNSTLNVKQQDLLGRSSLYSLRDLILGIPRGGDPNFHVKQYSSNLFGLQSFKNRVPSLKTLSVDVFVLERSEP